MALDEKIRTTVDIFGTTYKMVGSFSQAYMKKIATYVNDNMETVAKSSPRLDSQKVAVLALISMADEYFQLQGKWEAFESEHSQSKQRIEELRKAFELTEEKERGKSNEVRLLQERIHALELENARLAEESEMASLTWSERVEEWEAKYNASIRESQAAAALLTARVAALEAELSQREAAALAEPPDAVPPLAPPKLPEQGNLEFGPADSTLAEKYEKLQEEYMKLQNEFNEWIELTQSETQ